MGFKGKLLSACAVTVLAMSVSSGAAAAGAGDASARAAGNVAASRIQIANFGKLNANYYRGEQPVGRDYADLAALGIRTVIDLQADGDNADERQRVEAAGMTFHRIPMTTHVAPSDEQITDFLQIVNDPARQPVYVHCKGGKHRTGVMTAVYRMEQDGWTSQRAFQEMKQYKFGMDFLHPEFKQFVSSYTPAHGALAHAAVPSMPAASARN
jgi:tyrosine-protein phosphatase SIW14